MIEISCYSLEGFTNIFEGPRVEEKSGLHGLVFANVKSQVLKSKVALIEEEGWRNE